MLKAFPYDSELDSEGNITDNTAIYTYRLLDDYRAKKLEIIPEVVGPRPPVKVGSVCYISFTVQLTIIYNIVEIWKSRHC
jgi:hypothetical protein